MPESPAPEGQPARPAASPWGGDSDTLEGRFHRSLDEGPLEGEPHSDAAPEAPDTPDNEPTPTSGDPASTGEPDIPSLSAEHQARIVDEMRATDPEAFAALEAEWADDMPANLAYAHAAVKAFADDPSTLAALNDLPASPELVRMAARIGRRLAEDDPFTQQRKVRTMPRSDPRALDDQIDELTEAKFDAPHKWNQRKQARLDALYSQRYGDADHTYGGTQPLNEGA